MYNADGRQRKEHAIKAKAELIVSGDRYEPVGYAFIEIEKRSEGFFFSWKAVDSVDTEIAEDSRTISFTSMDDSKRPHPYLEQFIRTHIQKTQLKGKNRMKVSTWTWIER